MSSSNKRKHQGHGRKKIKRGQNDPAIYGATAIVAIFIVFLVFLLTENTYTRHAFVVCLAIFAFLVIKAAWSACAGKPLSNLNRAYARMALRPAGYGKTDGKPVDAAHDQADAKSALVVAIIVALVFIATAVAVLLWPGLI